MGLNHTVPSSGLITQAPHHPSQAWMGTLPQFYQGSADVPDKKHICGVDAYLLQNQNIIEYEDAVEQAWRTRLCVQLVFKHSPSGLSYTRKVYEKKKGLPWTSSLSFRCLPSNWVPVSIFFADLNIRAVWSVLAFGWGIQQNSVSMTAPLCWF